MTYTVKFADVTAAIAALNVTGVTIKDISAIPEQATLLCPIMFPQPNFVTDFQVKIDTLGTAGSEKVTLEYDINYIYTHCTINAGLGGMFSVYAGMITNILAIIVKILLTDNPRDGVTLRLRTIPQAGPVNDPAGNQYWGCLFSLHVLEYCEVP